MSRNSRFFYRYIFLTIIFTFAIILKVCQRVIYLQNERKHLTHNIYVSNVDNITYDEIVDQNYNSRNNKRHRIVKIKNIIKNINLDQNIYNTEHLNYIRNDTFIIVIQTHSDVYLLQELIASLEASQLISDTLLIFSHDVYSRKINKAIHAIKFARFMQIFYPYSVQLHPNVYPGVECTNNCGNTRDVNAAQMKHFWWWQTNQVFGYLDITRNYTNTILFLEENNYVTEDFLIIYKALVNARKLHCPACEFISMAAYNPDVNSYNKRTASISFDIWSKKMPKTAIAFDRTVWHKIKRYRGDFCYFNDYNWDNSLKHIGAKYMDMNFHITAIDAPRVFNIKKCNENHKDCNIKHKVADIKAFINLIKADLYPLSVVFKKLSGKRYTVKPMGHFDDERDRELCMYFTENCIWY